MHISVVFLYVYLNMFLGKTCGIWYLPSIAVIAEAEHVDARLAFNVHLEKMPSIFLKVSKFDKKVKNI